MSSLETRTKSWKRYFTAIRGGEHKKEEGEGIKRVLWNTNGIKNKSPYSFKTFRSWSSSNWKHTGFFQGRSEEKKWGERGFGRSGGAIGSFDTLPKSLLHYLDLDVGFSKQIVQQVCLANRMLRSDATSGCSVDNRFKWFVLHCFFFLDRLCERERMNGNDDFRVFENFANIFRKFLLLNGNIFILIFVYVCIQSTFFYYDY